MPDVRNAEQAQTTCNASLATITPLAVAHCATITTSAATDIVAPASTASLQQKCAPRLKGKVSDKTFTNGAVSYLNRYAVRVRQVHSTPDTHIAALDMLLRLAPFPLSIPKSSMAREALASYVLASVPNIGILQQFSSGMPDVINLEHYVGHRLVEVIRGAGTHWTAYGAYLERAPAHLCYGSTTCFTYMYAYDSALDPSGWLCAFEDK
jgi:hypothetical protein